MRKRRQVKREPFTEAEAALALKLLGFNIVDRDGNSASEAELRETISREKSRGPLGRQRSVVIRARGVTK